MLYLILAAGLIAVDQLAKLWALCVLRAVETMEVIPGFLRWTYVENRGAAFGMLAGQRWILSVVSLVVVAICVWCLAKKKFHSKIENISVVLIAAGGFGNLIDRVMRGFVVDYIDVNQLFSYPMFNFADCCVVVGALLFLGYTFVSESVKKKDGEKPPTDSGASE